MGIDDIAPGTAGQKLSELRVDRGWTATELAAAAGCSTDQVKIYESGQRKDGKPFTPKPEMVAKFAHALGGGYRQMVLEAYGLPIIDVPQVIDLDQVAEALEALRDALGFSSRFDRVKPGYRDWSLSAVVNHFPLGLATHPTPQLAN